MKNIRIQRHNDSEEVYEHGRDDFDKFIINVPKKNDFYFIRQFEVIYIRYLFKYYQKLGILSEGTFFGEEELLGEIPRENSIQCVSNDGELFFLNKKVYLNEKNSQ